MAGKLVLRGRIAADDPLLDTDLRDLEIITGPGGRYLCAATGQNGGISIYQVANGQLAALQDSAYFSVSGIGVGSFSAVEMKDRMQLILDGAGTGQTRRPSPRGRARLIRRARAALDPRRGPVVARRDRAVVQRCWKLMEDHGGQVCLEETAGTLTSPRPRRRAI